MKFREHRGGLSKSMETVVEVGSKGELVAHVVKMLEPFYFDRERIEKGLNLSPYSWSRINPKPIYDERIGWHTYIVTLEGYGVLGFTDGPLPDEPAAEVFKREDKAAQ
jgi:hypothetical protein